jgi:hypothetical protein
MRDGIDHLHADARMRICGSFGQKLHEIRQPPRLEPHQMHGRRAVQRRRAREQRTEQRGPRLAEPFAYKQRLQHRLIIVHVRRHTRVHRRQRGRAHSAQRDAGVVPHDILRMLQQRAEFRGAGTFDLRPVSH